MAEQKLKRVIKHPKLYMRVNDKLQRMKVGTPVTVTKDQARRLGAKLADPADQKEVDVSGADVKEAIAKAATESQQAEKAKADAAEAVKKAEAATVKAKKETAEAKKANADMQKAMKAHAAKAKT